MYIILYNELLLNLSYVFLSYLSNLNQSKKYVPLRHLSTSERGYFSHRVLRSFCTTVRITILANALYHVGGPLFAILNPRVNSLVA